jgi:tetratricopeptide (TPR) repeat protein
MKNARRAAVLALFGVAIALLAVASPPTEPTPEEAPPAPSERSDAERGVLLNRATPAGEAGRRGTHGSAQAAEQAHTHALLYIDKALDQAQRAVAAAPDQAAYRDTLAGLYFLRGQGEQALREQTEAVRLAPDTAAYATRLKAYQQR